jgi:hypothetical protein
MKSRLKPNCSAKSLTVRRIQFANLLGAGTIGCLLFLAACGEEPQGLDERITQLHKELDRTQAELQSSKEELARLKANPSSVKRDDANPPPTSSTTVASREALEASYMAEAKALKKQLQSQLKDFTLGSFTLHNVQLPDNQFPITSWISLAFQTGDGKQFRLDFAVKADSKGGWVFPEPAEIARRAAEAKKIASTSDTPERRAPNEPQPNVATTMPSTSTSVIQWPGSTSSQPSRDAAKSSDPAARQNPAAAPPAPQAPPAQAPKQAIPADRDVLIRF